MPKFYPTPVFGQKSNAGLRCAAQSNPLVSLSGPFPGSLDRFSRYLGKRRTLIVPGIAKSRTRAATAAIWQPHDLWQNRVQILGQRTTKTRPGRAEATNWPQRGLFARLFASVLSAAAGRFGRSTQLAVRVEAGPLASTRLGGWATPGFEDNPGADQHRPGHRRAQGSSSHRPVPAIIYRTTMGTEP